MRNIGVVVSGEPGQGKTLTALSFTGPQGQARRMVIDCEGGRSLAYRGEVDKPDMLKYAFTPFPSEYEFPTLAQMCDIITGIATGDFAFDVIIIDNVVLFQEEMQVMMSTQAGCRQLANILGIYPRHKTFIEYNFGTNTTPWWGFVKAVIKGFLLACRKAGVSIIATTEIGNVWQNFGSTAKDEEHKQKVLGKSAKLLQPWLQLMDAVWVLSRYNEDPEKPGRKTLKALPTITLDAFVPKSSLPGVPPRFEWQGWEQIWTWLGVREIPTTEQLAVVEVPEPQVSEPESEVAEGKPKPPDYPKTWAAVSARAEGEYGIDKKGFRAIADKALKDAGEEGNLEDYQKRCSMATAIKFAWDALLANQVMKPDQADVAALSTADNDGRGTGPTAIVPQGPLSAHPGGDHPQVGDDGEPF